MTEKEVLEKAIQKAIDNGWDKDTPAIDNVADVAKEINGSLYGIPTYPIIIFNKQFAKALWGDKFINPEMRDDKGSKVIAFQQTAWRHHLRQMVISDNPIKYLEENI